MAIGSLGINSQNSLLTKTIKMKNNFFLQLIQRIATESPKFFKIIQWVAGVLAVIAGALTFLIDNSIWNPSFAATLGIITKAAWPLLTAIWGMSLLPVKDQTPTINTK